MAEYIVAIVVEKIAGQLIEEAGSLSNVHEQIEWIKGELRRMQSFLKDADLKQDSDQRIRNWVADIRDVTYDTDDFIDKYVLKRLAKQRRKGLIKIFNNYTCFLNELISNYKVNNHINMIKTRIHEITESRSTYGIENIGKGSERTWVGRPLQVKRQTYPHALEDDDLVGLEEDLKTIESRVVHGGSKLSIISIIGMAGLGKTTLVKKIFLSYDVKKNFDYCAWIYVSQEYRSKEILNDLAKKLMGLGKEDLREMNNEELKETISIFLQDKRYIIVLDDIWKFEVWNDLKEAFPNSENGSRIMITTRFKDVALHADPRSPPHELRLLNDEDSWELFSKKVRVELNSKEILPPWSQELGKQIVEKCGGLPLAIVVLGGVLSRKDVTYNEWLKIYKSVHWQLKQDSTQCEEILELSYLDLPFYLKSCFLYFGIFPEDFEIPVWKLILLWVAEGFVQPRGQEPLEDVAEDYLEELIGRSMIQVAKRKSNGRIKTCRIHDLLRELSISKAREDQFLDIVIGEARIGFLTRARRLAIHSDFPSMTKRDFKFRSLLCFNPSNSILRELKRFNLLRVLDLEGVYITNLDSSIGNLIHLRYLGLRETWLQKLPSSIQYLSYLQTLDLRSTLINPIPISIWKAQSLRHLYFNELQEMLENPPKDSTLANLQTLRGIHICQTSRIEHGLENLTNLRELGLHGDLNSQESAITKWISVSENLECLKMKARTKFAGISYTAIPESMTFSSHTHLYKLHLGGFISKFFNLEEFPPNLTELSLKGSFLMEDPMEKLEKLPSLRVLKLKQSSYLGKELVCSNGGFPQLQFLKLSFLLSVETLRIEEGAMENLRELEIVECKRLKIVPRGLKPVTSLRDLKLGFMPLDFPMKVQEREGENWYRIQHVLPV